MYKYYVTEDRIADFVSRMWAEGIKVSVDPKSSDIVVHKKDGGFEYVCVIKKNSFNELCDAIVSPNNEG
jgi:hypothetical protein